MNETDTSGFTRYDGLRESELGDEAPFTDVNAGTPTPQITSTPDSLSELRVKVAELCGWDEIEIYPSGVAHGLEPTTAPCLERITRTLPNYPSDLNACHEFEKTIMDDPDMWHRYGHELAKASDQLHYREHYCSSHAMASFAHIPAEQRCRAFVAVMKGRK